MWKFLNQRVAVARNTFIRGIGEDFLTCCPRSGASFVINNARPLELALRGGPKRVEEIISSLSEYMDCSFEMALEGYGPLLKALEKDCLVEVCDGTKIIEKSDGVAEGDNEDGVDDGGRLNVVADPIHEYYVTHHLPIELHLDLTDACTERCVHCYVSREQEHFLPVELAEKVLTEFREMNGITVHLSGGEVMMHPDFERICRKCVELNLNLIILSNMTLADESRIGFLKEIDPQVINVSLYSMKPEEHDTITQLPGSWARTYLNAKGDYYPCASMHGYALGNVRKNTMMEIWEGEKLNYLRGLKNRDFGACASCENRPWCKVCLAANFNATGDLFRHHPEACARAGVVKKVYGGK